MKWLLLLIPTAFCYLAYSFVLMEMNAALWSIADRAMIVMFSLMFTFPVAGIISEMKK